MAGGFKTAPLYWTVSQKANLTTSTITTGLTVGNFATTIEKTYVVSDGPAETTGIACYFSGNGYIVATETSRRTSVKEKVRTLQAIITICEIHTERTSGPVDKFVARTKRTLILVQCKRTLETDIIDWIENVLHLSTEGAIIYIGSFT